MKIWNIETERLNQIRRILSLFILVFEGFGIRFLDGVVSSPIIWWTALLTILNIKQIVRVPVRSIFFFILFCTFYTFFVLLKGVQINAFFYAAWVSAFCVLSNYAHGEISFLEDLYKFTKICVYYDLLHIAAYAFFSPFLFETDFGMNPYSLFYVFYYNRQESLFGLLRIQGFCWEPSCWNCLLNLNLATILILKKPMKEVILCVLAIISVFSTTGFITMSFAFILYFILYSKRVNMSAKLTIILLLVATYPLVEENIIEKIETGSGATRYGDFFVAEQVIKESPLLGGDLDNITSNQQAMMAKMNNWGYYASQLENYDAVGMTNAFAALFVEWGFVITLCLFFLMFVSPLFTQRKDAFLIACTILVVLMGTPIARTGFFYMFSLSSILFLQTNKKVQMKRQNILLWQNKSQ